jgi:hypothetical protein
MFKAILPSKRISSSDFTMVAGPGITGDGPYNGKENLRWEHPQQTAMKADKSVASKGLGKSSDRHKTMKLKDKETNDQSNEPVVTEDAFDRLLVSALSTFPELCTHKYTLG